jgi:hypothetical protein
MPPLATICLFIPVILCRSALRWDRKDLMEARWILTWKARSNMTLSIFPWVAEGLLFLFSIYKQENSSHPKPYEYRIY